MRPKPRCVRVERHITMLEWPEYTNRDSFLYCRLTHKKKTVSRCFNVDEYDLAKDWLKHTAASMGKKLGNVVRPGITQPTNTGEKGITVGIKDGGPALLCYALLDNGVTKRTSFSIRKHGYPNAMKKAKKWRNDYADE